MFGKVLKIPVSKLFSVSGIQVIELLNRYYLMIPQKSQIISPSVDLIATSVA